jgi:Periplasmic binding protein
MAKDAAVASTTIFIMTIPLVSGQHRLPEAPEIEQPKRDAPLFPSPLSQSGFHRCTLNDALTALTTQPKSACITCTVDPFWESVARIARTRAAEAVRIEALQTTVPESGLAAVSGLLFGDVLRRVRSSPRFEFSSKFLESAALQSGTPCDRYPATAVAPNGKQNLLALEIWRDDVNAKGGLLGRPVELVYYDDQSNPNSVPGIYTKLISVDKVDLLIGPYATNMIAPAMPVVMQANKMTIGMLGVNVNRQFNYSRYFSMVPGAMKGRWPFRGVGSRLRPRRRRSPRPWR